MRMPLLAAALALAACESKKPPAADAGPDMSCGLDCEAQEVFGLIVNRCFEYSADPAQKQTPALGVWVRPLFELEGGIKTLPVEYRKGGMVVQTDYFAFVNGALTLMRRATPGQSVTYRTGANITGVKWLDLDATDGETSSTSSTAGLLDNSTAATTYRVITSEATSAEQSSPLGTFEKAIGLQFSENPDHGSDTRRIFVAGTGFTRITSPFNVAGGSSPTPNYLQKIRDVNPDGGSEFCSLGAP